MMSTETIESEKRKWERKEFFFIAGGEKRRDYTKMKKGEEVLDRLFLTDLIRTFFIVFLYNWFNMYILYCFLLQPI